MKITPEWIATFETNVQTFIVDAWNRVQANLMWQKCMDVRPSGTGRELYFWLIESARIYDENQGGNKRYDDLAATFYEIVNKNSGAGLVLTKNEIEDNMMKQAPRGPALDYAANWAKQMGGAAGYWPQQKLFELILAGTSNKAYDAKAFFAEDHPVHPLGGSATYANLYGSLPLFGEDLDDAADNLQTGVAAMMSLVQPNGAPRFCKPRYMLHSPKLQYVVNRLLEAKFFNATENVFTNLGVQPISCPELVNDDNSSENWYLVAELMPGEGGPFIYQDREGYVLSSYSSDSQVELNRRKQFEWLFDGRNAAAYGHPYLCFRFEPSAIS